MNDLISRQAAIDAFKKELTVGESKGNYVTICSAIGYKGAKQILESLPSVTPERKTGRWIVYKAPDECHCGLVKCPFCYEELIAEPDEYNYCPNCGADMRGEEHETD